MYRPEGMKKNPFDDEYGTDGYLHIGSTCPHCIFEAGADAMLEGLKRRGEYYTQVDNERNGWLVFIPEEKR